jgi:hypothetical protein
MCGDKPRGGEGAEGGKRESAFHERIRVTFSLRIEKQRVKRPGFGVAHRKSDSELTVQSVDGKLMPEGEYDLHPDGSKIAAVTKGFDSIVLVTPMAFSEFATSGKLPHSIELNLLCERLQA